MPAFSQLAKVPFERKIGPGGHLEPVRLLQMATHRREQTEEFHQEQLRTRPHHAEVWNNYGAYLLDVGQKEAEAEAASRHGLRVEPECSRSVWQPRAHYGPAR
jgi:predicted Zn-dependent protease